MKAQLCVQGVAPADTKPHIRAHMGGNHVIGFRSSTKSATAGPDFILLSIVDASLIPPWWTGGDQQSIKRYKLDVNYFLLVF